MKIIDILKQRSDNPKDDVKIELKLYNLADDLEKKSRNHLKRITTVLTEFDIHDEKHSEKVIENIEKLLGEEKLHTLSTYELFLLHLSAFFHDCAMAPSDWEINTMKLTEGNETYFQNSFSIKHDLKTPLQFSVAQKAIIENKANLYIKYDSDVKEWMFTPRNEDELIKYLSILLIEYQNYRNGFADKLKNVNSQAEFNELSEFIRIDYIRATHHSRIETYIKNLETLFGKAFPQPAWGKRLAHDLSLICRSHGEDASFIDEFSTNSQYYGAEDTNLQFVAIMLRLGDIIHFSYDRASIDLRSSKLFKSEYSFQQWAIKNSGVNYSIDKGKISYRAYCENPETYFKLHQYIDWIEIEIQSYFRFQRQWPITYIDNLQDKVERINVSNDEDVFLPKRGLNFTLNQNKILDLLMGVGLYKDKYACLRELYQNSLDAVRCMLSQNEVNNSSAKGLIEFKLIKEEDKTYLCCIDNGVGMTKDVIENYLLKIGNSYYKSSDFFKQQANWGGKFTPTSQFGIGILSCFMIGDKLEITTKSINGEYLSCAIEGLHESFYYKKAVPSDKEYVPLSGTIVKVLLNEETASKLNNKKVINIELLQINKYNRFPEEFQTILPDKEIWAEHLFNKLNDFVIIIPENITLTIGIEDETTLAIPSKPLLGYGNRNSDLGQKLDEFIDYKINYGRLSPLQNSYANIKGFIEKYKLHIQVENTEYVTTITLPKKHFVFEGITTLFALPNDYEFGLCIDGIHVNSYSINQHTIDYSSDLFSNGVVNFAGELRPQISVDRTSIIKYPQECEKAAQKLTELLIKKVLEIAKQHIFENNIDFNSNEFYLVWEYIYKRFSFANDLFIHQFFYTEYGDFKWLNLSHKLFETKTVREFLLSETITLKNYSNSNDFLTEDLLLTKLILAKEIKLEGTDLSLIQNNSFIETLFEERLFSDLNLLIQCDKWNIFDTNIDLVSNLWPLVPERIFNILDHNNEVIVNNRIKHVSYYANGFTSFFSQNPLLVHPKLGLYTEEDDFEEGISYIYRFDKKRRKTWFHEINKKFENSKEGYVLVIFIAPCQLTSKQSNELEKYSTKDLSYVKGVREGWSILATSMDIDNIVIAPGKVTREHLVSLISDEFWKQYKDYTFKFTDNTIMQKSN